MMSRSTAARLGQKSTETPIEILGLFADFGAKGEISFAAIPNGHE
jgi:hypothetical protein